MTDLPAACSCADPSRWGHEVGCPGFRFSPGEPCLCGDHPTQLAHFEEEFTETSRLLIVHKAVYYYPDRFDDRTRTLWTVGDAAYDSEERWYLILCKLLGKPNTLVHDTSEGSGMMEVDFEREDVKEALEWVRGRKR